MSYVTNISKLAGLDAPLWLRLPSVPVSAAIPGASAKIMIPSGTGTANPENIEAVNQFLQERGRAGQTLSDAVTDLHSDSLKEKAPTSQRVKGGLLGGVAGTLAARVRFGDASVEPFRKLIATGANRETLKALSKALPPGAKALPAAGVAAGLMASNVSWGRGAKTRADKNVEIAKGLTVERLARQGDALKALAVLRDAQGSATKLSSVPFHVSQVARRRLKINPRSVVRKGSEWTVSNVAQPELLEKIKPNEKEASVGNYVQDAARVPKPVSQPKVSAPGTAASLSKMKTPGLAGGAGFDVSPSTSNTGKIAEDASILPLLGLGAGGVGGYIAGKRLINPYLLRREGALREEIARKMREMHNYQAAQKYVPAGAALTGAILLAALIAGTSGKFRARREHVEHPQPQYRPYAGGSGGYNHYDAQHYGG